MKGINVSFSVCDDEYLSSLRLVAGSVCVNAKKSIDDIEDFKLCVGECALIMKRCGYDEISCTLFGDSAPRCEMEGRGGSPVPSDGNDISLAIIEAFVKKCDIRKRDDGTIEKVILEM